MTTTNKDPILVVVQLTGGNDFLNTVIPYNDPLYFDYRPKIGIAQDEMLPIDDSLALNPALALRRQTATVRTGAGRRAASWTWRWTRCARSSARPAAGLACTSVAAAACTLGFCALKPSDMPSEFLVSVMAVTCHKICRVTTTRD